MEERARFGELRSAPQGLLEIGDRFGAAAEREQCASALQGRERGSASREELLGIRESSQALGVRFVRAAELVQNLRAQHAPSRRDAQRADQCLDVDERARGPTARALDADQRFAEDAGAGECERSLVCGSSLLETSHSLQQAAARDRELERIGEVRCCVVVLQRLDETTASFMYERAQPMRREGRLRLDLAIEGGLCLVEPPEHEEGTCARELDVRPLGRERKKYVELGQRFARAPLAQELVREQEARIGVRGHPRQMGAHAFDARARGRVGVCVKRREHDEEPEGQSEEHFSHGPTLPLSVAASKARQPRRTKNTAGHGSASRRTRFSREALLVIGAVGLRAGACYALSRHMRSVLAIALVFSGCAGEPAQRSSEERAIVRPVTEATSPSTPAQTAPRAEPDFTGPFPAEACPPVRVRLAHRSAAGLPGSLTHAIALRSEDGRHIRIVLADHELAPGDRFESPGAGHARVELDAIRTRRGPLQPGRLGAPDARNGGLTHVRVVSAGELFTFGHRNIGSVELTEVGPERVCGRLDLNDGFARVRGAFSAPVRAAILPTQ